MDVSFLGKAATPYNDLAIPEVMGSVMLITRSIGLALFSLFFFAEALRLQAAGVENAWDRQAARPRWLSFLWRSAVVFLSSVFLYKWAFLQMVSLCDNIAMAISDEESWMRLLSSLSQGGATSVSLLNVTVPTLLSAAAMSLLQIVEDVLIMIRFVMLSLLFIVGPIVWSFGISELGLGAVKGWFKNTWQVSFWLVAFSAIKASIVPLGISAFQDGAASGAVLAMVYAVVIVLCILLVPAITAALFSQANIDAVGGAVTSSIVSYTALRSTVAAGGAAHRGIVGAAAFGSAVKSAYQADGVKGVLKTLVSSKPAALGWSASAGGSSKERTR
ncbi:MAG: hypothetical protein HY926_01490 [Elusimicrobia bacterium]|nr:hypothetical protein [Elusimicrobiota bacterium]